MTIIFAENFGYDTEDPNFGKSSVEQRYPGSRVRATADGVMYGFQNSYLQTGLELVTPDTKRLEILLGLARGTAALSATGILNVFGIEFEASVSEVTVLNTKLPDLSDTKTLNMVIEKTSLGTFTLRMLADDNVILEPLLFDEGWLPNSWLGRNGNGDANSMAFLPDLLTHVVIARDTAPKTYISTPTFTKRSLELVDAGAWTYSDAGYVQDTDKVDPTIEEPFIATEENAKIELTVKDLTPDSYARLYTNVKTAIPTSSIKVNGVTQPADEELLTVPALTTGATVTLETVTEEGRSNSKGLRFYGERNDVISYADLSTQLNLTAGTVNAAANIADHWLHVNLDGKELLVAKGPVRWGLSWDDVYAAGLVYGQAGPGPLPYPDAGPKDQKRTLEIGGVTYIVRLLKGADLNPTDFVAEEGQDNVLGTQGSEWSRIFFPLVEGDPAIPVDEQKLANYTATELGMGDGVNGAHTLCQETNADNPVKNVLRGAAQPSQGMYADKDNPTNGIGWRPVLQRVST